MTNQLSTGSHTPVQYAVCSECDLHMFPVLPRCANGHRVPLDCRALTGAGVVYSWTATDVKGSLVRLAMVDFFDGRLRLVGRAPGGAGIGDRLKAALATDGAWEFISAD